MIDRKLTRWSTLLFILAVLSGMQGVVAPVVLLVNGTPINLVRGSEVWSTTLQALSNTDGTLVLTLVVAPQLAWLYAMVQVGLLALCYRRGEFFDRRATGRFVRIGVALGLASVANSAVIPILGYVLHARGVLPWLPDMPMFAAFDTSLAMGGAFFYIIGKIMQRGAELQDSESLTI